MGSPRQTQKEYATFSYSLLVCVYVLTQIMMKTPKFILLLHPDQQASRLFLFISFFMRPKSEDPKIHWREEVPQSHRIKFRHKAEDLTATNQLNV